MDSHEIIIYIILSIIIFLGPILIFLVFLFEKLEDYDPRYRKNLGLSTRPSITTSPQMPFKLEKILISILLDNIKTIRIRS